MIDTDVNPIQIDKDMYVVWHKIKYKVPLFIVIV
jgi:hypothetical protein